MEQTLALIELVSGSLERNGVLMVLVLERMGPSLQTITLVEHMVVGQEVMGVREVSPATIAPPDL
jgi:hypothetical protein